LVSEDGLGVWQKMNIRGEFLKDTCNLAGAHHGGALGGRRFDESRDRLDSQIAVQTQVTLRFMPNMTIIEGLAPFPFESMTDLVRSRIDSMPPMHHAFRPAAERLEAHVLLSSVATALATGSSSSPIVETVTTNKSIYKVGQPIRITLTTTNTTNNDVVFPNPTLQSSFTVSRDFKIIWKSTRARPRATPLTLQPGQTHTVTVTWNGRPNVGSLSRSTPLTGTVEIDNALASNTVNIAIDPVRGKGSNAGVTFATPKNNEVLTLTQ
jgi:hypothetical protein